MLAGFLIGLNLGVLVGGLAGGLAVAGLVGWALLQLRWEGDL